MVAASNNLSGSGAVLGNQAYGPYGNTRYTKGSVGTQKGFTGQTADPISGLDNYGARYYDPVVGRFVSADAVQGNAQGMDPYAYVGGNPETHNDPTGNMFAPVYGASPGNVGGVSSTPTTTSTSSSSSSTSTSTSTSTGGSSSGGFGWVGGFVSNVVDAVTGIPSMIHDVQTVMSSKATTLDKVLAVGDFVLNAAMDVSMLVGIGEVARVAYLGIRIGLDIGMHVGEDLVAHSIEEVVAHSAEETASHSVEETASHSVEGAAANCGGLSFAFATKVATAQGKQAIGTMQPGEKVWAYNPKTKQMELQPVLHVWINHDNDLVDLTLTTTIHAPHSSKTTTKSEVIHTNKKHPFLTEEQGFVPVGQLHVGMHVREADGQYGVITTWKLKPGIQTMYNLEVAQDHTFTVGDEQWIVHNCGQSDPVHVSLPKNRYPQTAAHIEDAIASGQSKVLTLARDLADDNRANSLADYPTVKGYDRDEYPMAFTKEGGAGADVRYIDPSDNRGAGSFIAKQLSSYPNGTTFIIDIVDEWLL